MAFKKNEEKKNHEINVTRARLFSGSNGKPDAVVFDMVVNGVSLYGCRFVEGEKNGKPYKFVSFPNYKGSDGKYYSHCWVSLTDEDTANIETALHKIIDCE